MRTVEHRACICWSHFSSSICELFKYRSRLLQENQKTVLDCCQVSPYFIHKFRVSSIHLVRSWASCDVFLSLFFLLPLWPVPLFRWVIGRWITLFECGVLISSWLFPWFRCHASFWLSMFGFSVYVVLVVGRKVALSCISELYPVWLWVCRDVSSLSCFALLVVCGSKCHLLFVWRVSSRML